MKTLHETKRIPGSAGTAPTSIVLSETTEGYATHVKNLNNGEYFWGHYFDTKEYGKALEDLAARYAMYEWQTRGQEANKRREQVGWTTWGS